MPKKFLLLFIAIWSISCKSDDSSVDCSLVDCAVASNFIHLRFLNPENDENLLENETMDTSLIEIVNEQSEEVAFTVQENPVTGKFLVIPVSTESFGQKTFAIDFEGGNPFSLGFETSFSKGKECCGPYTLIENVQVDTYSHELIEPSPLPILLTVYIPES